MPDLQHQFGADLEVGPTGDLAMVTGAKFGQQRVLRRLLTNSGDYMWHLGYGAGLAQLVGQPADAVRIHALIRGHLFKEAAVAQAPEPAIDVRSDGSGMVYVQIRYTDAGSGETQVLGFDMRNGA